MSSIKKVAIVGASGSLGSIVFEKLKAAGTFDIIILRRPGSKAEFPAGSHIIDVEFDTASLTKALQGVDAVVSTVGTSSIAPQRILIDAAINAGVKRILPSEFGCDLDNLHARELPVFMHKVDIQDYLIEKAKNDEISYTFVYNASFLDWGIQYDFLLKTSDYKPIIIDEGNHVFTSTTMSTVGDSVVGILNHPEETKNRPVYIEDIKITQNILFDLAKKVAPEKPWQPEYVKLEDLVAHSNERLVQGLLDMETFGPYLLQSIMAPGYGGDFAKTDNELLGLKRKTEEDIIKILKDHIK